MSNTPESDIAVRKFTAYDGYHQISGMTDVCRKLERERDEYRAEYVEAKAERDAYRRERDALTEMLVVMTDKARRIP